MAAHKYYETMKGKEGIGIQYVYHVGKKGKRIVTELSNRNGNKVV